MYNPQQQQQQVKDYKEAESAAQTPLANGEYLSDRMQISNSSSKISSALDYMDDDDDDAAVAGMSWLSTHRLISDCLFHILSFLGPAQLGRVARSSRDLRALAELDSLWMPLTYRHFGKDLGAFPSRFVRGAGGAINWKLVYEKFGESNIELEFRSGPRQNEHLVVSPAGATVGRSRQNSVCILHDEMVSRKHARIIWRDRRYWIHDVGGINGTMVNTASLPQHVDCLLHFGDEVDLGASSFAIRIHCPPSEEERLTARQQQQN